jgi:hypothetical protein
MTDPATLLGEARRELARFPAILDSVVDGLAPGRWRARPAPDEWAAVEIVCHSATRRPRTSEPGSA